MQCKVATVSDLKAGQMKEVKVDDKVLLLSNVKGQYYASAPKCTHYGANLINGILTPDGCLTCPWHGATFNLCKGGDIEEAPAWDALPTFPVTIKGSDVFVEVDKRKLETGRTPPDFAAKGAVSEKHTIIVGGGASGYSTAECLREYGYDGKITILGKEPYLPIDRTKISKTLIDDPSKIAIRGQEHLDDLEINLIKDVAVESVDTTAKSVTANGKSYNYTSLVLSSGGIPKSLPLPNFDLPNVYLIRGTGHAKSINEALKGGKKKIVIIGSSFIGMEAAMATVKDHDVTVVGMEKVPLERVLGEQVGKAIQSIHEKSGVKFKMPVDIKQAQASNGKVTGIELKDGEVISADLVICGVGISLTTTSYLKDNPSFELDEKDGSLTVDGHMQVKGVENVYATGDIAKFPYPQLDVSLRIEHWDVAMNHGRTAAKHIAEGPAAPVYDATLYFWSAQGSQLRYCGTTAPPVGFDDIYIQGDLSKPAFAAFYCKGDKVVAVCSMGYDPAVSLSAQLMAQRRMPSKSELKEKDIKAFS